MMDVDKGQYYSGDWRRHLSAAQARQITRHHGPAMLACGYDPREAA